MKKAVILFSGGLDSTTVLAYAKNNDFECHPITFNYGQRHSSELNASKRIANFFKVNEHKIINLPNDMFGKSALTRTTLEVPNFSEKSLSTIPITYVPARNTIFLAIALGYAESIGAQDIFLGISNIDYSGYPDCRPEYIEAFVKLANLATKDAIEGKKLTIHSPLLHLSKAQTIELGIKYGVDYSMTVSCYNADPNTGAACGRCDSCSYRRKGFMDAGLEDTTVYV